MKEGDIVLALLPQTDGRGKFRPAVLLRRMPGFGDLLVCGISTQLRQQVADFDEINFPDSAGFSGCPACKQLSRNNRFHFRAAASALSFGSRLLISTK